MALNNNSWATRRSRLTPQLLQDLQQYEQHSAENEQRADELTNLVLSLRDQVSQQHAIIRQLLELVDPEYLRQRERGAAPEASSWFRWPFWQSSADTATQTAGGSRPVAYSPHFQQYRQHQAPPPPPPKIVTFETVKSSHFNDALCAEVVGRIRDLCACQNVQFNETSMGPKVKIVVWRLAGRFADDLAAIGRVVGDLGGALPMVVILVNKGENLSQTEVQTKLRLSVGCCAALNLEVAPTRLDDSTANTNAIESLATSVLKLA